MGLFIWRRAWTVLGYALVGLLGVRPAWSQFTDPGTPDVAQTDQVVNVFVTWQGDAACDGFFVDLPLGWSFEGATLLRHGYLDVPVRPAPSDDGILRYRLAAPNALHGHHELILQLQTSSKPGPVELVVEPYVLRNDGGSLRPEVDPAHRLLVPFVLELAPPLTTNRVLDLPEAGPPLLLHAGALPSLTPADPFTIEFWLRTTVLNRVVMSAWDGDEAHDYPLEFVIDADGRLLFFRGHPGQHQAVKSVRPVADGQWHHVAVSNDPETGRLLLLLNGLPVDSLYSPTPPPIRMPDVLALGNRLPPPDRMVRDTAFQASAVDDSTAAMAFVGALDEVRIWSTVRSNAGLRREMRRNLPTGGESVAALTFDEPPPPDWLVAPVPRGERVFADLALYLPLRNVRAILESEAVHLTWDTPDGLSKHFLIDRSFDGRRFDPIGQVETDDAITGTDGSFQYRFIDTDIAYPVLYYRIRQQLPGGAEHTSGILKVGMGAEPEPARGAVLLGNYPNPFNETTTINYEVHEAQHLRLSVWDVSGQLVATLVDQQQPAGTYQVTFKADDLPSGTYLARLETTQGVESHKMILAK